MKVIKWVKYMIFIGLIWMTVLSALPALGLGWLASTLENRGWNNRDA